MTQYTERQLVLLAQEALPYDTRFFQQLIAPYISPLKSYSAKILGDNSEAEDVVQEVLIKALTHLKTFKWKPSFKAWLFRIAHNECIDKLRKLHAMRLENDIDINDIEFDDVPHDIEAIIAALITKVSIKDRNIFLLRFKSGLEFQEIAEVCGMTLSAVKMRHKRLIDVLQAHLPQND